MHMKESIDYVFLFHYQEYSTCRSSVRYWLKIYGFYFSVIYLCAYKIFLGLNVMEDLRAQPKKLLVGHTSHRF